MDLGRNALVSAHLLADQGKHQVRLLSACGGMDSDTGCADRNVFSALQPGTHWLAVKSATNDGFGRFTLGYRVRDLAVMNKAFASAATMAVNRPVSGTTVGAMPTLRAVCERRSMEQTAGDRFHRFVVSRAMAVSATVEAAANTAGVVRLMRDPANEIDCGQWTGTRSVTLRGTLVPGTYYLVVSAMDTSTEGNYLLNVTEKVPE
jgi:hypothetical protein